MGTYGGLSTPVAVLVGLLLAAYLSLYPAVFAMLLRRATNRFGFAAVWLAPLLWVATEWLRSTIGGGFPWVLLGYSQASVLPVVQVVSLVGIYGLSALVAAVNTAAAAVALRRGRMPWAGVTVVVALLVAATGWGSWRVNRGELT